MNAKSLQLCSTLCDPMDWSAPGSSAHGILQASILELVVISYSRASSWPRDWTYVSYVLCIGKWVLYHWCHIRCWVSSQIQILYLKELLDKALKPIKREVRTRMRETSKTSFLVDMILQLFLINITITSLSKTLSCCFSWQFMTHKSIWEWMVVCCVQEKQVL